MHEIFHADNLVLVRKSVYGLLLELLKLRASLQSNGLRVIHEKTKVVISGNKVVTKVRSILVACFTGE